MFDVQACLGLQRATEHLTVEHSVRCFAILDQLLTNDQPLTFKVEREPHVTALGRPTGSEQFEPLFIIAGTDDILDENATAGHDLHSHRTAESEERWARLHQLQSRHDHHPLFSPVRPGLAATHSPLPA